MYGCAITSSETSSIFGVSHCGLSLGSDLRVVGSADFGFSIVTFSLIGASQVRR
jgi:hypothetical protein